jgi:hypothetical protein
MPLFFVLSGMIAWITQEKTFGNFRELLFNKLQRLLVPFAAWGIFFMLPIKYFAGGYGKENIMIVVVRFLIGNSDMGHLWFLLTLFVIFVMFYPLSKIYNKVNRKWLSVVLILAISLMIRFAAGRLPVEIFGIKRAALYLPYFAGGFLMGELRNKAIVAAKKRTAIFIMIFAACLGGAFVLAISRLRFTPLSTALNGIWIYCLCRLFQDKIPQNWVSFMNNNALRVYCLADPLNYVILYFFWFYRNWFSEFAQWELAMYLFRTIGIILVTFAVSSYMGRMLNLLTAIYKTKNVRENI